MRKIRVFSSEGPPGADFEGGARRGHAVTAAAATAAAAAAAAAAAVAATGNTFNLCLCDDFLELLGDFVLVMWDQKLQLVAQ